MTTEIFKILAICLTATALCVTISQKSSEYAFLISLSAGICILIMLLKKIAPPLILIEKQLNEYGVKNEYFKVALKATGIGYVTSFIADICRDSGQTSLASKAELAGKCAIFLLAVPLMISVFEMAIGFIK